MHVITGLGLGGAESMLVNLAAGQTGPAVTHRVVSLLPGGENAARLHAAGVPVDDLGMTRGQPSLSAIHRLSRLIRLHRPQIVQSWMYHADLAAWAACALVKTRQRPRLVWGVRCSDMRVELYGWQLRWAIRACARLSGKPDAIIVNSQAGAEVHGALGYRTDRMVVIANGVDVSRFRPDALRRAATRAALGISEDETAVALVARVDAMKDHGTFLSAIAGVPGFRGILIGRGTEGLDLPENVVALGPRADVHTLLPAFDVIALSSAFGEGFPNALVEGMAAGLVPVATDVGDSRGIVGDTGFVVRAGSADAFAHALREAAAAAKAGAGALARQRVIDHFALPVAQAAFRDVYSALLDPSQRSGQIMGLTSTTG